MNTVSLGKELKIRTVKKQWEKIKKLKAPLEIDCSKVEKFDGAGFQFLIYILGLEERNSKKYTITGISEQIKNSMSGNGYVQKGETK